MATAHQKWAEKPLVSVFFASIYEVGVSVCWARFNAPRLGKKPSPNLVCIFRGFRHEVIHQTHLRKVMRKKEEIKFSYKKSFKKNCLFRSSSGLPS